AATVEVLVDAGVDFHARLTQGGAEVGAGRDFDFFFLFVQDRDLRHGYNILRRRRCESVAIVHTPPTIGMSEAAVRLAAIRDVHCTAKPLGWKGRDLVSKRVTGWMNVTMLGRGYRFRHATVVADALTRELKDRRFDHLIFTGDATALGFESEF